ncbi:hypothetical protein HWV01_09965 [Moritella sp. 5]|uniref:hypothetical protein n=1 Tax=Moritella sp. 5 TaxID=2746231 RepID=UPI001BA95596|nr:hypothetical protein [Moritella sp. 5]QUM80580.1 hypothetical protein HWV01_09965 [Moritella sp. 5]
MNLFKNTIAVGMLLLTSGVNASSLDSVSAQNNGVFLAMQQLQLEQGKPGSRSVVNADILFIDSNITKVDQLTKKMLSAYNAIVIIGDKSNNKTLMIDLFGFGVQRDVIAISNIHDLKTREINTYNVGKDTADMKVATVLSSVISKHIN